MYTTKNKHVVILPLMDIHYGSNECNESLLDKGIAIIKSRSDIVTFLGGDILETSIYGSVGAVHSQRHQLDQQIENIVKKLKPIKNKILFAIDGNHEHRVEKATGLNLTKIIADMLSIRYEGWEVLFNIQLGKHQKKCKLYAHHGTGSAISSGAKLNSLEKLHFRAPLSNVIVCGHLHFPMNSEKEIRYVDDKGIVRKYTQYYVGCGSTHESDGYATMKGLSPLSTSLTMIKLQVVDRDFVVDVKLLK